MPAINDNSGKRAQNEQKGVYATKKHYGAILYLEDIPVRIRQEIEQCF
jgi:hypothetical protein